MDFWDLKYTSEDLKSLCDFILPSKEEEIGGPTGPTIPKGMTTGIRSKAMMNTFITKYGNKLSNDFFNIFTQIEESNYDPIRFPFILMGCMSENSDSVAVLTCPFPKLPTIVRVVSDPVKKIIEWRLQRGV